MAGFTLLELMIVLSIILIIMSIALPMYNTSILRSKEAVLKQDLFTLREVIDQYTYDKQKAPQSLEELTPRYLKQLPVDPMTGQRDWVPVECDSQLTVDQTEPGICDVHSASGATSSDGQPYSESY